MSDQKDQKEVELQPLEPAQYPPPAEYSAPSQYPPPSQYPEVTVAAQPIPPARSDSVEVQAPSHPRLGLKPQVLVCPYCHHNITTKTRRALGLVGWLFVAFLFMICLGTCLPLCCIPCCIPSCYDTRHFCPNCGGLLGQRSRLVDLNS